MIIYKNIYKYKLSIFNLYIISIKIILHFHAFNLFNYLITTFRKILAKHDRYIFGPLKFDCNNDI